MKYSPKKYQSFYFDTVKKLLAAPSPSGYYDEVMPVVEALAKEVGATFSMTKKGCAVLKLSANGAHTNAADGKNVAASTATAGEDGKTSESSAARGICAHVDTLGLMVRSILPDGHLAFTKIGGPILPTLDGEYVTVLTRSGKRYTGTVLSRSPAVHVFEDASSRPRDEKNMYIRLDERVSSAADTKALGISAGDYVFYDPKTVVTDSGYLKSRFIDDKASAAEILTAFHIIKKENLPLPQDVVCYFTMYEEVGHGAAFVEDDLCSMLAVDMGCVGDDLSATEEDVSICALDRGGPYDYRLTRKLVAFAEAEGLNFATDIYPYYGSDIGAMWRAGHDIPGALIGSGVHASHGMERTHVNGIFNTINLILCYLTKE